MGIRESTVADYGRSDQPSGALHGGCRHRESGPANSRSCLQKIAAKNPGNYLLPAGGSGYSVSKLSRMPEGGVPFDERFLRNKHGLLNLPTCEVLFSSLENKWTSMFVSHQSEAPFQRYPDAIDHHLLVVHLSGPARNTVVIDNKKHTRAVPPGGVGFWPSGVPFGIELERQIFTLHVYIASEVMADVGHALGVQCTDTRWLRPLFAATDELLERLAIEAWNTAQAGFSDSELYADQIARAMAARLVWVSRQGFPDIPGPGRLGCGLSKSQLRRLEEYIEVNLDKELHLESLSGIVGLSVSHFSRQFKSTSGKTPHQFVLQRRLERARRLLGNTTMPIAEIAIECGFSHQEHLTHTFRRQFAVTPAGFRRQSQA